MYRPRERKHPPSCCALTFWIRNEMLSASPTTRRDETAECRSCCDRSSPTEFLYSVEVSNTALEISRSSLLIDYTCQLSTAMCRTDTVTLHSCIRLITVRKSHPREADISRLGLRSGVICQPYSTNHLAELVRISSSKSRSAEFPISTP